MADRPILVVVNGIPGTGKSTLSKKLSKELGLPCIGKDDIKELLFDKMGTGDLKWSQDIGAGVAEMLFAFIEKWIGRGRSLIAESAYYHDFARPNFKALIAKNEMIFLEIYCKTDSAVRIKRFISRNESGHRHPGHKDHNYYSTESEEQVATKYAPIALGDIIEVDTTSFSKVDYLRTVSQIHNIVAKNQKEKS